MASKKNMTVESKKLDSSTETSEHVSDQKIEKERQRNAEGGFFLKAAVWILARFPFTRFKYQNWTKGRRILIGWLLWFICLPIIPIAGIIIWYLKDPNGFKKSPWAKALIALAVVWAGAFGIIATEPAQLDQNGKYSPIQTAPDGETSGSVLEKPASTASEASKKKVEKAQTSNATNGRKFENCTEAFEAGVFDIKLSDDSYQQKLDRDDDGIACER